jgi:class II poly(R)-hydroxyalkanoic acid synthase
MAAASKGSTRSRKSSSNGGRSRKTSRTRSANGRASGSGTNGNATKRSSGGGTSGTSLESLLTDATLSPVQRWLPGRAVAKVGAKLATRPHKVAQRGLGLSAELAKVAVGRSEVEPPKGDRRWKDPAWMGNPLFRRLAQAYLAAGKAADGVVQDADADWESERRIRFAVENVVAALSPTNFPATNPTVLKAALDTGGLNFVNGARQFVRDMARPPRIPSMVDKSAFEVGKNVAVTPGEVVLRTDVFELIQYAPQTKKVRETPLLVTPPMINKYYVTDIAPDRSMIEYAVRAGEQVFAISWRNPDERFSDWSLDTYAQAVVDALDAVEEITGSPSTHTLGLCAGGIVLSSVVAHLAANGEGDRIAGLTLGVCVLDNEHAGTASAFVDPAVAAMATAESARKGYLDGRGLAGVFAWLRPNDLIWNYWVNNYLLGKEPPAFDVLFWNADTTNMPAALHRDFMKLSIENSLAKPGELTVLGTPIDLSVIDMDSYVVAGIADHITPWQSGYRTTQLLGSDPRFVLSTSGHIAAMVNPPGNEKASYQTHTENPPSADEWLKGAATKKGTWWDDWMEWLGERSGKEKAAPQKLGSSAHKPLEPAPGKYVREEA